jgi:hypothetical protein
MLVEVNRQPIGESFKGFSVIEIKCIVRLISGHGTARAGTDNGPVRLTFNCQALLFST